MCWRLSHNRGQGSDATARLTARSSTGAVQCSQAILKGNNQYEYLTATMALIAGLIPAVYAALKLDEHLPTATRLAECTKT
jgi:hypothetical protein